ncbi:MAG TPA: DUF2842 domain-containing protein [Brevundimonas sp.]|jgi:hypothetical protein|uniref:DUF2842 domain-containing protein n=1 Tax=Brevundimonas sp. TaxID=1871086 RepID=UPI002BBC313D|nr:DUF2842 domain-containing protein [Brevundimonas sp.]HRH20074.1 DUF2842 domain-containing protein [Brevundimonas sp.]
MGPRTRKAIATVGILAFLAFYVWAVVSLARFIPPAWWAQVLYFAVAGLAWGVPVLPLIKWGEKG